MFNETFDEKYQRIKEVLIELNFEVLVKEEREDEKIFKVDKSETVTYYKTGTVRVQPSNSKLKKLIENIRDDKVKISSINKKIVDLIKRKEETSTVDFKLELPKAKKFARIAVCMANVPSDEDSYLIIGVDDKSKEVADNVKEVKSEEIMDTLSKYSFAGGKTLKVELKKIYYKTKELYTIVIKRTSDIPYYVEEDQGELKAYKIYSRYGDTNTDSPKYEIVRKLWEKQFK